MLVHLIASKSRVAPTKQTTIPRLELCATVLLAKLVHRVKQALKLNVTNTFLWSDSMIVLSWIRKESYQLKTFVANRIATIQEMTSSEQWRYVATEDNPADFVSRGMDSLKLKTCELWWNGPKFLMSNQYPRRQIPVAVIKDPGELKNCSDFSNFFLDSATNSFVNNLLNLSNDYFKIIRVLSFICRFVYNCKSKESKRIGPLDLGELKKAEQLLLKLVKKEEFKVEMNGIQISAMVPSNSRVKTLNPFIDNEGILRKYGKFTADCIPDGVFPIGDDVFVFASTYYDSVSVHIRRFKKYGKTYYPTPEGITLDLRWIEYIMRKKKVPESLEELPSGLFPPERHI
ncbi:integrase catalytic domain-containing protein [Trichonephila clavipes]|nr:integrase catalytic domain-containing protein [Trichonephila clavipes]